MNVIKTGTYPLVKFIYEKSPDKEMLETEFLLVRGFEKSVLMHMVTQATNALLIRFEEDRYQPTWEGENFLLHYGAENKTPFEEMSEYLEYYNEVQGTRDTLKRLLTHKKFHKKQTKEIVDSFIKSQFNIMGRVFCRLHDLQELDQWTSSWTPDEKFLVCKTIRYSVNFYRAEVKLSSPVVARQKLKEYLSDYLTLEESAIMYKAFITISDLDTWLKKEGKRWGVTVPIEKTTKCREIIKEHCKHRLNKSLEQVLEIEDKRNNLNFVSKTLTKFLPEMNRLSEKIEAIMSQEASRWQTYNNKDD